jgi:hypothetical protein
MVGHTLYVAFWPKPAGGRPPGRSGGGSSAGQGAASLVRGARLPLIMAADVDAARTFAPILGFRFDWVQIHYLAGIALTISIIYHIITPASGSTWSIWLNKTM